MLLRSADQSSVGLSIAGYQFPELRVAGEQDWDANWLRVTGTVVLADGRTWTFDDPCLTTWDAADLGQWLHEAAAGSVPPGSDGPGVKVFLEPNISFSLQEHHTGRIQLRVHLSAESLPPWLTGDARPEDGDYFVVLDVPVAELDQQAGSWMAELSRFPAR